MKLAEKLLLDRFQVGGSQIENAHRTGKAVQGHPRHVIARFYSRVMRIDVLRIYGRTKNKMADVVNRFQMLDEKCESVNELPIDMADTIAAAVQAAYEEDKRNKPKGGTPKGIATGKTRGNSEAKVDDWGNHGTNDDDDATDVDQGNYGDNLQQSRLSLTL